MEQGTYVQNDLWGRKTQCKAVFATPDALPAAPIALDDGFAGIHHFQFSPYALYTNLLMSSSSPAAGNQRPQSTFHRGLQETTDRYVMCVDSRYYLSIMYNM